MKLVVMIFVCTFLFSQRTFAQQKRVFDLDTRVRATGMSPTIGHIGTYCTGTLVAPDIVITAAHCVYSQKYKQALKSPYFRPGRDGDTYSFGQFHWRKIVVARAYAQDKEKSKDIAFIKLHRKVKGIHSFFTLKPSPKSSYIKITGYPKDREYGTSWSDECEASVKDDFLEYQCDTTGGMSGSSIIQDQKHIIGIHALGGEDANKGMIIDDSVLKAFSRLKKSYPVDSNDWITYFNNDFTFYDEFDRVFLVNPSKSKLDIAVIYYDFNREEKRLKLSLSPFEKREVFKTRRSKFYLRYQSTQTVFPQDEAKCEKFDGKCFKKFTIKGADWGHYEFSLDFGAKSL